MYLLMCDGWTGGGIRIGDDKGIEGQWEWEGRGRKDTRV